MLRIKRVIATNFPEEDLINYPVKVTYRVYGKTKRSFDIDNRIKFLQDCLNKTILEDDKHIVKLSAEKFEGYGLDKVEIIVEEYNRVMEDL